MSVSLMSLGPIVFDLVSNIQEVETDSEAVFAVHEVVNSAPVYEGMGEGEVRITLDGVIHPEHWGGLGTLAAIDAARAGQIPLPLMRGNFIPIGWVIVEGFNASEAHLNHRGLGREIKFSVDLLKVGSPGFGMIGKILSFF